MIIINWQRFYCLQVTISRFNQPTKNILIFWPCAVHLVELIRWNHHLRWEYRLTLTDLVIRSDYSFSLYLFSNWTAITLTRNYCYSSFVELEVWYLSRRLHWLVIEYVWFHIAVTRSYNLSYFHLESRQALGKSF